MGKPEGGGAAARRWPRWGDGLGGGRPCTRKGRSLRPLFAPPSFFSSFIRTRHFPALLLPPGTIPSLPPLPPLQVFPQGLSGLLFGGFKGEVWIQPGEASSQGALYRDKAAGQPPKPEGAISLVLGEASGLARQGGGAGQGSAAAAPCGD